MNPDDRLLTPQLTLLLSNYLTIEIGNQKGKGSHPTIQIRDLLKAQGYKWNSHQHRQIWYRHDLRASFTTREGNLFHLWG
ncbi:MAG: hypothetical protein DWQ58_09965 [Microcystis aeruginosa TA09]|nr:MAG: hypothetical protein DWQ58_09965 [Microcystis aeruginosa TA09]